MNAATAQATVLVDELIAGGMTDVVLAPGSRNAPLAFALHAADAAGRLRLHVRIDERGAGFLALGIARGSRRPVAVATTSGTAVANLHPAVLEAHHGGVPLVVLSADRPAQLRGVGANQVIDQLVVFGAGVLRFQREFALATTASGQNAYWRGQVSRALAAARGDMSSGWPGPVQLNIPFDTPLTPNMDPSVGSNIETDWYDAVLAGSSSGNQEASAYRTAGQWPEPLTGRGGPWTMIAPAAPPAAAVPAPLPGEKCLFVADLTHPQAGPVAALGHLVISEAGGLAGRNVLAAGMHLLADVDFVARYRPDRVVVLGRPTLFRSVNAILAQHDIIVDVVDNPVRYADLAGAARMVSPALAGLDVAAPSEWAGAWRAGEGATHVAIDDALKGLDIATSAVLARTMAQTLPQGASLLLGSSQSPRDIARFALARDGVRVLANRGVAGIDGTVSTAVGAALAGGAASQEAGPTYALMGDLTFLHDVTALAIGPHEPRPDLTIVVANNDGGGIFSTLEQGAPQFGAAFERIFGTPTGAQIAQIAEGFGVEHVLAMTTDEFIEEVSAPPEGLRIVEVPVTRTDLRQFGVTLAQRVSEAIGR